jgi:methylenetetrahydrofolate--tRNA-(uracil-5-)-methyltransferase
MPVEIIAKRGKDNMRFGPMKPVGLRDPRTGETPYAVVQLRPENNDLTMYNLVGFQTSLRWGEQERVFQMIPGLERAEFLRFGAVHRNTYINAPTLLRPTYQLRARDDLFFAGQITGVEGYIESTAAGWVAGVNAARLLQGKELLVFPRETLIGALANHITTADPERFQPMNANLGILPPLPTSGRMSKQEKKEQRAIVALAALKAYMEGWGEEV